MKLTLTTCLASLALTATANAVGITLVNPAFYGQANSTSQTWADFGSPAGPNAPTTVGLNAGTANYFDRTATSDGAFLITGSDPSRGRIYSPTGVVHPEIDVPLPNIGSPGFSTIVLQTQVSGNPLDASSLVASNGTNTYTPQSVVLTTQATQGSQGPSTEYDYVITWGLLPAATQFTLTYAAANASSSQSVTRVDTFTQTPEPASLGMLGLAGAMLLRRRRSI